MRRVARSSRAAADVGEGRLRPPQDELVPGPAGRGRGPGRARCRPGGSPPASCAGSARPPHPPPAQPDLRQVVERQGGLARAVAAGQQALGMEEGALRAGQVAGAGAADAQVAPQAARLVPAQAPPVDRERPGQASTMAGPSPSASARRPRRLVPPPGEPGLSGEVEAPGLLEQRTDRLLGPPVPGGLCAQQQQPDPFRLVLGPRPDLRARAIEPPVGQLRPVTVGGDSYRQLGAVDRQAEIEAASLQALEPPGDRPQIAQQQPAAKPQHRGRRIVRRGIESIEGGAEPAASEELAGPLQGGGRRTGRAVRLQEGRLREDLADGATCRHRGQGLAPAVEQAPDHLPRPAPAGHRVRGAEEHADQLAQALLGQHPVGTVRLHQPGEAAVPARLGSGPAICQVPPGGFEPREDPGAVEQQLETPPIAQAGDPPRGVLNGRTPCRAVDRGPGVGHGVWRSRRSRPIAHRRPAVTETSLRVSSFRDS